MQVNDKDVQAMLTVTCETMTMHDNDSMTIEWQCGQCHNAMMTTMRQ